MKLTQSQIAFINENECVILATAGKDAKPRAAVIMPSRIEAGRIILSDVQMGKTAENIKSNAPVFLSSYNKDMSRWLKIEGRAKYIEGGPLFEEIRGFETARGIAVKAIVEVEITSAQDGVEE
jgi:uncharacterized pyridoxamine 5'-phosphate oxidase family protein